MSSSFSATMAVDDSFKQPGAIPFKWEIRPGVPKVNQSPKQQQLKKVAEDEEFSFPVTPRKLAPPPAGYRFQPPLEARTGSFRSVPRSRSARYRLFSSNLAEPVSVSGIGCFSSPILARSNEKKHKVKKPKPKPEWDSAWDPETLSRWSVSSRKSLSPFRDSPSSSSSSYQSTPKPMHDADWAGFGLF